MYEARKRRRALPAGLATLAIAGLATAGPVAHAGPGRATIAGGAVSSQVGATATSAAATGTVSLRVYLAPRGGLDNLKAAVDMVSSPDSPSYGHYLTPRAFRAQFAPAAATVQAVSSWLASSGLAVTGVEAARRFVSATGSVAAAESAFGTSLVTFQKNGETVQAPASDVSVPAALGTAVTAVTGLNTAPTIMRPNSVGTDFPPPSGFRNARPCSLFYGQVTARFQADLQTPLPRFEGSYLPYAPCGYVPAQFRSAYEGSAAASLDGAGQTVAITDAYASTRIRQDANTYATRHGDNAFGAGQLGQVVPGSFTHLNQCDPVGWAGEETLDVEAVHGLAPGARVLYYGARSCYDTDFLDTLNLVLDQNQASIISNSWGSVENGTTDAVARAYDQVFLQAGMQGVSVLFSSGDYGDEVARTGIMQADFPASNPYITALGGTSTAIGPDGSLAGQTGWGTDKYTLAPDGHSWLPIAANPFLYGSGGGFSTLFGQPAYQRGVVPPNLGNGRAVPDIALDGDPTTGMLIGITQQFPSGTAYGEYRIGGTSLSSPLMAGIQALANQHAGSRAGFLNPYLYRLARTGAATFQDVLPNALDRGNVRVDYANGVNPKDGLLYSVRTFDDDSSLRTRPGWDEVTGIGTPNTGYITNR